MEVLTPSPAKILSDIKVLLDPTEYLQAEVLSGKLPEPQTLAFIQSQLRSGDVMVDVGCHIGIHALVAAKTIGPTGKVLAIDPQPANCHQTIENARLNGYTGLVCQCAACGETDGALLLSAQPTRDRARLTLSGTGVNDGECRFATSVYRLESLFSIHDIENVDLLKIDVEGFELAVLRGLGETIKNVQMVILEILPETDGEIARQIVRCLADAGFSLQTLEGKDWSFGEPLIENNLVARRTTTGGEVD